MGSGSAEFCRMFAGSGTKICHAFEIKDQKFGCKKWVKSICKPGGPSGRCLTLVSVA